MPAAMAHGEREIFVYTTLDGLEPVAVTGVDGYEEVLGGLGQLERYDDLVGTRPNPTRPARRYGLAGAARPIRLTNMTLQRVGVSRWQGRDVG